MLVWDEAAGFSADLAPLWAWENQGVALLSEVTRCGRERRAL